MDTDDWQGSSIPDGSIHHHINKQPTRPTQDGRFDDLHRNSHERHHHNHLNKAETVSIATTEDDAPWYHVQSSRRSKAMNPSGFTQEMFEQMKRMLQNEERRQAASGKLNAMDDTSFNEERFLEQNIGIDAKTKVEAKETEMVSELHETSWSNFKNRYYTNTKDYVIEVMIGEPEYRRKLDRHSAKKRYTTEDIQNELDNNKDDEDDEAPNTTDSIPIPNRIRINSPQILNTLSRIDKSFDSNGASAVMLRPFKFLVHHEAKIRDFVRCLQVGSTGPDTPISVDDPMDAQLGHQLPAIPKGLYERELLLQHMLCLLQFIDKYIAPTTTTIKNASATKITFDNLWYLFHPGEDIFMPVRDRQRNAVVDAITVSPEMFQDRYERVWRVLGVGGGRHNLSAFQQSYSRVRKNPFKINCYYLDFDGVDFFPISHEFSIQPYSGERDITSLDFFPLRFLRESNELRQEIGRVVFDALIEGHTHFYYCGPTLTTQPCGCPLQNGEIHQEHVESEIIIDFSATRLKHPAWRPHPSPWKRPSTYPEEVVETFPTRYWSNKTKTNNTRLEIDHIYDDTVIDITRALIFKDHEPIFEPVPTGWLSKDRSVPPADIALLCARVFAFVLRTRQFAALSLWALEKIDAQTDGLKILQLRDNTDKETIHALVRTHFLQKSAPRSKESECEIVRGKGKGLIFLLHGAPGVGKTFTAESVAAANGRPLFQITCGDLGLTPTEVENSLKEIFRFAQMWNCVLLLDECDIFLEQRTKFDLKRNSVVSVFLRVLEWYSGVLFLTTNRVGTLDSAVKSRVTWSVYYPPLNLTQTKKVWKSNLNLLEKKYPGIELDRKEILKFATAHFRATVKQDMNWNGRQIQNAFKVAESLADWGTFTSEEQQATDTGKSAHQEPPKLKITAEHFRRVAVGAETFDNYLQEATGFTEAQRAYNALERADNYINEDDAAQDDSPPEPPTKKRRTGSTSSSLLPPLMNGGSGTTQMSAGGSRRLSNAQKPPDISRKRSPAAPITTKLQPTYTSNMQSRSPGGLLSPPAVPTNPRATVFDNSPSNNRKRSVGGFSPDRRRSSKEVPHIEEDDNTSDSEVSVDQTGVEISDDDDDSD